MASSAQAEVRMSDGVGRTEYVCQGLFIEFASGLVGQPRLAKDRYSNLDHEIGAAGLIPERAGCRDGR